MERSLCYDLIEFGVCDEENKTLKSKPDDVKIIQLQFVIRTKSYANKLASHFNFPEVVFQSFQTIQLKDCISLDGNSNRRQTPNMRKL